MKKFLAILLLSLHLFNLGGYLLINKYFIYRSEKSINEHISKNMYREADLVEIKIPVSLPQIESWNGFESVFGEVQLKGSCYNYVKLKVTKDTLFLMCVPNYEETRLTNNNIIYAKHINDAPLSKKAHETSLKNFNPYFKYNCSIIQYRFKTPLKDLQKISNQIFIYLKQPLLSINGQPPDIAG